MASLLILSSIYVKGSMLDIKGLISAVGMLVPVGIATEAAALATENCEYLSSLDASTVRLRR